MVRNLVLCADGTCNAFGHSSSNVARLLEHIELQRREEQVVCYDQGIGTLRGEYKRINKFKADLGDQGALCLLPPPNEAVTRPWTWPALIRSMAYGSGLEVNVAQLYETLARLYSPEDRVFLFGFSRGAFTVRALAGLTWRYGLPASNDPCRARALFAEAWSLFMNEFPDDDGSKAQAAQRFREKYRQRHCPVHFLGLWDTVKSYGGITPVILPHLRHNPSVDKVRHALSLDERRGWFELTTWGWLDSDQERHAAVSRLESDDIEKIRTQDVVEVWFSGCHADIGGGRGSECSSKIAFRWMLGEARCAHLTLNPAGEHFLARADAEPSKNESRTLLWKLVERKARFAINNGEKWPKYEVEQRRGPSPRKPWASKRRRKVWYHESVKDLSRFGTIPEGAKLAPRSTVRVPTPLSSEDGRVDT